MEIKKLLPTDAEDLMEIRLEALRTHPEDFADCYDEESDKRFSEYVKALEKQTVFGCYVDGKICGMVGVRPYEDDRRAHTAYIWGVYISDEHKGKGYAKQMMNHVLAYAEGKFEKVILKYFTTTDIVSDFYAGFGFKQYGVDKKALIMNDTYYDECLMVKFFD